MSPFTRKDESIVSPRDPTIKSPRSPKSSSIKSWKGAPNVNTISNIAYIITRKIGNPNILLVMILSIFSLMVTFKWSGFERDSFNKPSMNAYLAFAITSSLPSPKMPSKWSLTFLVSA